MARTISKSGSGGELRSRLMSKTLSSSRIDRSRSRSRSISSFLMSLTNIEHIDSQEAVPKGKLITLYRLLLSELNLPPKQSTPIRNSRRNKDAENAYDQLLTMIRIPFHLEKFVVFGLLVFLNSFLTLFTLVPLKLSIIFFQILKTQYNLFKTSGTLSIKLVQQKLSWVKRDILSLGIISISFCILCGLLDISKMYHEIRGEAHIKLYVMFGVLEVGDKLCSSLGQDIISILYSTPFGPSVSTNLNIKFVIFFSLSLIYLSFHAYILIFQTVSLNVAANSYSNALLALLLSNQFSELKSSVFKKFEREGLFQVAMADLTERFHLTLMLVIIALRNLLQLYNTSSGIVPNSWKSWNTWFGALFGPSIVVIGSEILVDWLKHCYISKFNKFRPRIYKNFVHVLSLDYLQVFKSSQSNSPQLHEIVDYVILTKRIGLPLISSVICFLRMTLPDLIKLFVFPVTLSITHSVIITTTFFLLISFSILLFIRLLLVLILLKWSNHIQNSHKATNPSKSNKIEKLKIEPDIQQEEKMNQIIENLTPVPSSPINDDDKSISSPIDLLYIPGIPNTEPSTINPSTRPYLYDLDEEVPRTIEEKRNDKLLDSSQTVDDDDSLDNVMRYEMSSKRIW